MSGVALLSRCPLGFPSTTTAALTGQARMQAGTSRATFLRVGLMVCLLLVLLLPLPALQVTDMHNRLLLNSGIMALLGSSQGSLVRGWIEMVQVIAGRARFLLILQRWHGRGGK